MYCICFISISWEREENQLHVWWGWGWSCGITPSIVSKRQWPNMSSAKANGSFLPLMGVTLCLVYLSNNTQIWLFFPLYRSHKFDHSVEKYLFSLLDQLYWVVSHTLPVCWKQQCLCTGELSHHEIVEWSHHKVHQWLVQMFDQAGWSVWMSFSIAH